MRFGSYTYFIFALVSFVVFQTTSAKEYAIFDHYTVGNGLVSDHVNSLAQDKDGYVWIATNGGLSRFDGKRFRNYSLSEYPSILRNDLYFVDTLPSGNVVVGGYNGLLLEYDQRCDSFVNRRPAEFDQSYFKEVKGVCYGKKNGIYVYTVGGLYRYDESSGSFDDDFNAFKSFDKNYISASFIDDEGRFWLGSVNSIFICDSVGEKIVGYDKAYAPCEYVTSISRVTNDKVIVSFRSSYLWVFDYHDLASKPKIIKLPFGSVRCILKDTYGRTWFATDGDGLWFTDDEISDSSRFTELVPYNADQDNFKKIYALRQDKWGDIWIGGHSSGLWRLSRNQIRDVLHSSDLGLPRFVCSSFAEDGSGNILVFSDGAGIFKVSKNLKDVSRVNSPNPNIIASGVNRDSTVCLCTWGGGLLEYKPGQNAVSVVAIDGIHAPVNSFFSVAQMSDGSVWYGTANDGIYIKDENNNWLRLKLSSSEIEDDRWIYKVAEGKNGARWAISSNTLWQISKDGTMRMRLPDVSSVKSHTPLLMTDAACADDGCLLVATNKGVLCFDAEGDGYKTLDFVPQKTYRSVLKKSGSVFFVAGENEIGSFDIEKNIYTSLANEANVGFQFLPYPRAIFRDSKGVVFVGINDGFLRIVDKPATKLESIECLSFSGLYIRGEKQMPYSGVLADGPVSELSEISLRYNRTEVSVSVDYVDFKNSDVEIRYMLEGLNEEWTALAADNKIDFSYIPVGSYRLVAAPFNYNSGKQCGEAIALEINVLPPWWNTWWFKVFVVMLLAMLVYCYFRKREKNLILMQNILKDKVEERTKELRLALEDKDRIISIIGHDLKNPMFAIVSTLRLLLSKKDMPFEERESLISDMSVEAESLQDEMTRLVEWAKAKREEVVCLPADTNVNVVLSNVMTLLGGLFEKKHIRVEKDVCLEHYTIVDARMLGTIFRNMLGNSVKFTPDGGSVSISAKEEGECSVIVIADNGVGMSPEMIDSLLSGDNEKTTDGTNSEKGTGLGISICIDYIKRNNGSVDIESSPGCGTTIILRFRRSDNRIAVADGASSETKLEVSVDKELLDGNVVLVVDDDALICRNLEAMLSPYMRVVMASNGKKALELAEEVSPDIVLSDVDMPEMNGIEFAQSLSLSEKFAHVPVIFLSAKGDEHDRLRGLTIGAVDYIPKPFSQAELLIKVYNQLKLRQKQQSHILSAIMSKPVQKADKKQVADADANPFTAQFIKVIEKRYKDSHTSIEDLSVDMNMSQSTLNRRARSILGKTPLEILNEYRLNMAMSMLKDNENNMQIGDIAYETGFSDPAYFSRKFREYFGCTPSQV